MSSAALADPQPEIRLSYMCGCTGLAEHLLTLMEGYYREFYGVDLDLSGEAIANGAAQLDDRSARAQCAFGRTPASADE